MVRSLLRRALGAVKDQTSIGLARVTGNKTRQLPALEIAIVRATSHDELEMVDEKLIAEIVQILSFSRGYSGVCVSLLARRLSRTRNWVVALKVLVVIHRLVLQDSSVMDSSFDDELVLASRKMLSLSGFCDTSSRRDPLAELCSMFVRNYALYIDEWLDCFVLGAASASEPQSSPAARGLPAGGTADVDYNDYRMDYTTYKQDPVAAEASAATGCTPSATSDQSLKDARVGMLLQRIPVLQHLLEHVLGCSGGVEVQHPLVSSAMGLVVRDSFRVYSDVCDGVSELLNEFFLMVHRDGLRALAVYSRLAKQADALGELYRSCREMGIWCGGEFPAVRGVSHEHLVLLEDYLKDNSRSKSIDPESGGKDPVCTSIGEDHGKNSNAGGHKLSLTSEYSSENSWETFGSSSEENRTNNSNNVGLSISEIQHAEAVDENCMNSDEEDKITEEAARTGAEDSKLEGGQQHEFNLQAHEEHHQVQEESPKPGLSDWEVALMNEANKLTMSYSLTSKGRRKTASFSSLRGNSGTSSRGVAGIGNGNGNGNGGQKALKNINSKVKRSRLPLLSMSAIPGAFEFGGDEPVVFGVKKNTREVGKIGIGSPGSYSKLMNKSPQGYKHLLVSR